MPETPIYNLPFEHPVDDEPGHTLHGGELGTEPILAEAVEDELERIDTDVADLQTRMASMEAGTSMVGWVPIEVGSVSSVADFDVDLTDNGRFPVGAFELIRINMRYRLAQSGDLIATRINNDASTVYTTAIRTVDAANAGEAGVDLLQHFAGASQWRIAYGGNVSTNNLLFTMFHTQAANAHGYQATSGRQSTSATTHAWSEAWGSLASGLSAPPSSLRMRCIEQSGTPSTFTNAWFWAEGYRVPS